MRQTSIFPTVIDKNITLLQGLKDELQNISEETYRKPIVGFSLIGTHVRHILNFYDILFEAISKNTVVNFQNRKRKSGIEKKLEIAISAISKTIKKLQNFNEDNFEDNLLFIEYDDQVELMISSLWRHIQLHTLHHNGVIRGMLILLNALNPNFKLHNENFGLEESIIN